MKTKIKRIAYATTSVMLMVPAVVSAQWSTGKDNAARSDLPQGTLTYIIGNIMFWILGLVGIIAVIGFAISGIMYLTAAGDEGRIDSAKRGMTASITGVIVAIIGLVIVFAADAMLSGNSANY